MTAPLRLALLHPGAMGASVGASARSAGCKVGWLATGRSGASAARAEAAGLTRYDDLATLLDDSDGVIALCPPAAALATARSVAALAYAGIYVDANAVSPRTAGQIATIMAAGGAEYVDGGVIGPPAERAGTTRLYLSGPRASTIVPCFSGSALEAIDIGSEVCAASSLKMCYAAWTKGSAALLMAVAAAAVGRGVSAELAAEWARSLPDLGARLERESTANALKAWRFIGEMNEVAETFSDLGLPDDFHHGAARIYASLAALRDHATPLSCETVIKRLAGSPPKR